MTETEVERLVVRLVGDSTSYVKMLTDAQRKTKEAAEQVERTAGRIEKMQKHLEGFAATTGKVLSAAGITLGFKALYEQFDKSDDLINELTAVIKANGREVDDVLPKYRAFAKEMTSLTQVTSKGAILELAKQAETLGLSGEKAERAIKTAITLGAMKDSDPTSFMRQAVNFEKTGNAAGLARILGLMGEMEEDTTKAAEAAKLLERNWELVLVKGADGSARIERSLNSIKEIGKDAGKVIADVFEPTIAYLEIAAKGFQQLDPSIRRTIVSFVLLAAAIEPIILAYTFLRTRVLVLIATMTVLKQTMIGNMVMQNTWSNAIQQGAIRTGAAVNAYKAHIAILAVVAATYIMVSRAQGKFNEAMEESGKLQSKIEELARRRSGAITTREGHDRNVSGLESTLNEAKRRKEEADKPVNLFQLIGARAEREAAKRDLEEIRALYDIAIKARDAFNAPKIEFKGPSKETLDSIRQLNDDLVHQINTLGMSEADAKIYELRMKAVGDAAAQADLDVAEYNGRMLEAARAQNAANDSARDLVKSLELQVKTLGMTDRESAQVKLAMEGVDAETMKRVDNLYKEIEVWEAMEAALTWGGDAAEKTKEQFQALNAVVAGGADAAQLIYQYSNQFDGDTGAVNKAATLRRADFSAQPDRNFLGPQLKGADAMRETEKKLDDLKTVLEQIRDKEQIALEGADLVA